MTIAPIENTSGIQLGILGTHLGFLDALVPDENGKLPRNADGEFVVAAGAREIIELSPVKVDLIQISSFGTTQPDEKDALIAAVRELGLEPQLVMMVGGVNPMEPDDEDEALAQLMVNLNAALRNNIVQVNSTSVETWMEGTPPANEEEFQARVTQNIKLHLRAYHEAGLADSCIRNWNIEFLRPGEFQNFTSLAKLRPILTGLNEQIGSPYFKALIDAAHCGDSGLNIPENEAIIASMGEADEIGPFHCSVPTTRGCLSSDDGWVGALLTANAKTGKLPSAFVELFRHDDPALEPLRKLEPGHGVDTTLGRTYTEVMVDGLIDTVRRLNNLKNRGMV
ncbi:hypothetical protein N9044_00010 [bacterium]|jgi:hypothetical protein|nr:hypothetical protein [bacterium]MDF1712238.1 hypothetical protein [Akkermansiaceae bacterium]